MQRKEFLEKLIVWLKKDKCYRRMLEKIEKELENENRKESGVLQK